MKTTLRHLCSLSWKPGCLIGLLGNLACQGAAAPDAAVLAIKPRYYSWIAEPGLEWTEKNTGYAWADWKVPLSQTAIVLLDVWERHYLTDTEARTDKIVRERIGPLLEAARRAGMAVIHCPGPPVANHHPNLVRYEEALRAASASPRPDWPPPDFRARRGEFAIYRKPPPPPSRAAELEELLRVRRIHPIAEPAEGEPVILTGEELHEHLRQNGILFLFFAGFNTNACLFTRSYGAWEMDKRGYTTIVLRDSGTAMESFETADNLEQTKNAILMLEMFGKYSIDSDELRSALAP